MLVLRDYQQEAVNSIWNYFAAKAGNPIVAMPTATGKSVILADFLRGAFEAWPEQRVLMLTHVKELIKQNMEKLVKHWPTAPAGIYSAGLKRRDTKHPILFCGIASVYDKASLLGKVDLILIDECHLVGPRDESMYRKLIAALSEINPEIKVIGLSATPYRLGLGHLLEGKLFTDTCCDFTRRDAFNRLLDAGWLAPLVTKKTYSELDTTGVTIRNGEFVANELQAAVDKEAVTELAVQEIVYYGNDRSHWLLFSTGIEHAIHIADCLTQHGIEAKAVHSKLPGEERDAIIADFLSGKVRAVVNNNILTTGFDFPGIDLIAVLRPTQSAALWVQMLGRGTRPSPGKKNCLILDFAGNTRRLGPINDPVLPVKKGAKGPGQAPVRLCEHCQTYSHISVRFCETCGAEFPREHRLSATAYVEEVIASSAPQIEKFRVDKVSYSVHEKEGRPPSLQVSYYCGLRLFREWICFEHSGYARHKAHDWWKSRSYDSPPDTVRHAATIADSLPVPKTIDVWINTKYPEIKNYDF